MTIETMATNFVVLLVKQFSFVSQHISIYGFVLCNTVIKKVFINTKTESPHTCDFTNVHHHITWLKTAESDIKLTDILPLTPKM